MGWFDRSRAKKSTDAAVDQSPPSRPDSERRPWSRLNKPPIPPPSRSDSVHIDPYERTDATPQHWHHPQFSPFGHLAPRASAAPCPSGWPLAEPSGLYQQPPYHYPHHQLPPPPIVVNQNYFITSPSLPDSISQFQSYTLDALSHINQSVINLALSMPAAADAVTTNLGAIVHRPHTAAPALYDDISSKFDHVMTLIDRDMYTGAAHEDDLFVAHPPSSGHPDPKKPTSIPLSKPPLQPKPTKTDEKPVVQEAPKAKKCAPKDQKTAIAASVLPWSYVARVYQYANSSLPPDLPRLRLNVSHWPLVCLASQYSERIYDTPRGAERETHVNADWKAGTKAMVIKSVPVDDLNVIVFAIRGTASFMDWTVNLNSAPMTPVKFLDDIGNLCHSGFLAVARRTISPVAARLRQIIKENPNRASYSLLITGHSAGGAIASLIYGHMMSVSADTQSELNVLTGCFKRIHCITFGTPPISLLPLANPKASLFARKNLFLSFVNEGDPVARADKVYIRSLLDCFTSPVRRLTSISATASAAIPSASTLSRPAKSKKATATSSLLPTIITAPKKKTTKSSMVSSSKRRHMRPVWPVPPSTLCCPGIIVVLRSGDKKKLSAGPISIEDRLDEDVVAQLATDEQLRSVIWGDPLCHVMRFYAGRIEMLACSAVTVRGH